jgi:hypothetical protein
MSGGDTIDRLGARGEANRREGGVAGVCMHQRMPDAVAHTGRYAQHPLCGCAPPQIPISGRVLYDSITYPLAGRIFQLEDEQ